jgi:hypothetical protein
LGEKVVLEVYQVIVVIIKPCKRLSNCWHVRGWTGTEYFNWVVAESGIRPLTEEEEEMDFEEWEEELDFEGGIAYCDAALELALISHDKEWFDRMWARKKALQHLMAGQKHSKRRRTK